MALPTHVERLPRRARGDGISPRTEAPRAADVGSWRGDDARTDSTERGRHAASGSTRRPATGIRLAASASLALALGAVLLSGCGGGGGAGDGAQMLPGKDCTSCHAAFTVAGTVFRAAGGAEGVEVVVGGVRLTSNAAGNFFTMQPVAFPAAVEVRDGAARSAMLAPAPDGACNRCHGEGTQPALRAP